MEEKIKCFFGFHKYKLFTTDYLGGGYDLYKCGCGKSKMIEMDFIAKAYATRRKRFKI
jgi:hypothetical protein